MSLFSLRRSCSSTPTLAGLAIAQPLLGQAVSSASGDAVFPERNNAEEARMMSPARGTSMPRFFTEAPFEHVMARGELCQASPSIYSLKAQGFNSRECPEQLRVGPTYGQSSSVPH